MPELPDILIYLEALESRIRGHRVERIQIRSPFFVRSFDPRISEIIGREITGLSRIGKRIVWELEGDLFLVFHLMIAGRLRWTLKKDKGASGKILLAQFEFSNGKLQVTEMSKKKRASLHLVRGKGELGTFEPGGLEVLDVDLETFKSRLQRENHTVKRALTDPKIFSGIGNAYSDEILVKAGISPVKWTKRLDGDEVNGLFESTQEVLRKWHHHLRNEFSDRFPAPGDITAFRPGFSVHGKHRQPCGECGTTVQRIRYADRETNYCPRCQTGGKLLADRSLSRLLKKDWPSSIEAMEENLSTD